jgi:hypothetical protein
MNKKNKKNLMILAIIVIVIVIFVGIGFIEKNSQQTSNTPSQTQQSDQNNAPATTFAPPSNTPKTAALQFYQYFISSPGNPLANGAYKNNPYLTQDFKQVIGALYKNGNIPVFCTNNRENNVTVGKEQTIYYNNQYLTDEIISETSPVSKDLYRVRLENVAGKWLIFDINCIQ